jgi:hypothetical protein
MLVIVASSMPQAARAQDAQAGFAAIRNSVVKVLGSECRWDADFFRNRLRRRQRTR